MKSKKSSKKSLDLMQQVKDHMEIFFLLIGFCILLLPVNRFIQFNLIFVCFLLFLGMQHVFHRSNAKMITLSLLLIGLLIFLLLFGSDYEIYLVFMGLFILVFKVFFTIRLPVDYKGKVNYFIVEFALFYLLIISQKIITILNFL